MSSKSSNLLAYIASFLNAIILGFIFLFTKLGVKATNPLDLITFRYTFSFLFLSLLLPFSHTKLNLRRKNIYKLFLLSLTIVIYYISQSIALKYTASAEAGIIFATIPIFTALLCAAILKEKNNTKQKISICLSVLGVIYIFIAKGFDFNAINFTGILLLTLGSVSIAFYNLITRWVITDFTALEICFGVFFFGFIGSNIFSITTHALNGTLLTYFSPLKNKDFLITLIYLSLFCGLISTYLISYILTKFKTAKMSVFLNFSTIISIFAGSIFLNESIQLYHIIGSALILIGVLGTSYFDSSNSTEVISHGSKE